MVASTVRCSQPYQHAYHLLHPNKDYLDRLKPKSTRLKTVVKPK